MKSSFELAMERYGGESSTKLTEEQKERLSEIDRKYQAKIAEAELSTKERRIRAAGNREQLEQISKDISVEKASLRERCELEKDRVRNGNG